MSQMITSVMSQEQAKSLASAMDRKYGAWLGPRYFEVESQSDSSKLEITVTVRDAKGTFVYPIEARILYQDQDLKLSEARDLLLDYIDAYIEEFLTGGEATTLTIDWSDYECDGIDLQMRGQIQNNFLEQIADDLISGEKIDLEKLSGKKLH